MTIAQRIPTTAILAASNAPILDTTADDDELGPLNLEQNGLIHYADPAAWNGGAPMAVREKASGLFLRAGAAITPAKIASDPAFNGRPCMDLTGISSSTDLRIKGSAQSFSHTWVVVATRPNVGRQGLLVNLSLQSSTYMQALRVDAAGALYYVNTGTGAENIHSIAVGLLPSNATANVYAVSYSDTTHISKLYLNSGLAAASTFQHPNPATAAPGTEMCIGGVGQPTGASLGWLAKIGRVFIFDCALHETNPSLLAALMDTLRNQQAV